MAFLGPMAAAGGTAAAGAAGAGAFTGMTAAMGGNLVAGAMAATAAPAISLSSIGSLLTLGLTGAGALATVGAGQMQKSMYNQQAQQANLNARLEGLRGRQEALQLKEQRDANLASINAIYASRGGLTSSGTAARAMDVSRKNAADDIDLAMFNSTMSQQQMRQQASNLRQEGKSAAFYSRANALTQVAGSRSVQSLLDL